MFMNHVGEKAETRTITGKGHGVFAVEPIRANEAIVAFGGYSVTRATLDSMPELRRQHSMQIDDDLFLASPGGEPGDMVNHSCQPNCGIRGSIVVVAMRDIEPGEELTFDYAMSDSQDYDEFICACGAPECRGIVTGSDWLRPELQQRYRGYFSSYLERRIATAAPMGAGRRVFSYDSVDGVVTKGTRLPQFVNA